jgi:hypothetical protein
MKPGKENQYVENVLEHQSKEHFEDDWDEDEDSDTPNPREKTRSAPK